MKPLGRTHKLYTAPCKQKHRCRVCKMEHAIDTKRKMRSISNGINRTMQKRINDKITKEQFPDKIEDMWYDFEYGEEVTTEEMFLAAVRSGTFKDWESPEEDEAWAHLQ